jgi:hypothetical protein
MIGRQDLWMDSKYTAARYSARTSIVTVNDMTQALVSDISFQAVGLM